MQAIDILIIGGGVAGASLACSLAERGAGKRATIVDVDLFGKYSTSELNGGGVRCTFAEAVNIRLSLASVEYYRAHAKAFDYRQRGYLWMYDAKLWEESRKFLPVVRSFGLVVEELSARQLKERLPVVGDVSDLAGATLTPMDGRLSPHKLRIHYLNHAQAGGVELLDRWQVVGIEGSAPPYRVVMRRVRTRGVKRALSEVEVGQARRPAPTEEKLEVQANSIVNAAGPWAGRVAKMYGRELPITPLPRQVFLLRQEQVDFEPLPFFIDYPQDIYFRHYERDRKPCVLVSWSDPQERPGISYAHHGADYYRRNIEPRFVRRVPAMAGAELIGGWVGHYELSADKSAIVGDVPGKEGIFNLNGLSAHGVMQSRGLGEAMAVKLLENRWPDNLNLDELNERRFAPGARESEKMYV